MNGSFLLNAFVHDIFLALHLIAANSDTAIYNFLTIPDIFDANIRMQLSMTDP